MSFPPSFLNASNRRLHEKVEELVRQVNDRKNQTESSRRVVQLLAANNKQTRREVDDAQKRYATAAKETEDEASHISRLSNEVEGRRRECAQLEENLKAMQERVRNYESCVEQYHHQLRIATETSVQLEERVRVNLTQSATVQAKASELQDSAVRGFPAEVWQRLQEGHQQVRQLEASLREATDEHQVVLKELDAVRHLLSVSMKDQHETLSGMECVQTQSAILDKSILSNTATMEGLLSETHSFASLRAELSHELAECVEVKSRLQRDCAAARRRLDDVTARLKATSDIVTGQDAQLNSCKRASRVGRQSKSSQAATLEHLEALSRERYERLCELKSYSGQLTEFSRRLPHISDAPVRSLEVLLQSFTRQEAVCLERASRTQEKLNLAVYEFTLQSDRVDSLNLELLRAQERQRELEKVAEASSSRSHAFHTQLVALDHECQVVANRLAVAKAVANELKEEREKVLHSEVAVLRERLSAECSKSCELHQNLTSLRILLRRAAALSVDTEQTAHTRQESERRLQVEVSAMEMEVKNLRNTRASRSSEIDTLSVACQVLQNQAAQQMDDLSGAASAEEVLRGTMATHEATMAQQSQQLLLTLHLEDGDLTSLREECRNLKRKRDLLIQRYESSVELLCRMADAPSSTENVSALISAPEDNLAPEVLHARHLLNQSSLRQYLMQSGNRLDQRIVVLTKEVEGLKKKMLLLRTSQPTITLMEASTDTIIEKETIDLGIIAEDRMRLLCAEVADVKASIREATTRNSEAKKELKSLKVSLSAARSLLQQRRLELSKAQDMRRKVAMRQVNRCLH